MQTHKGEINFVCQCCEKVHSNSEELENHLRIHQENKSGKELKNDVESEIVSGHIQDHKDEDSTKSLDSEVRSASEEMMKLHISKQSRENLNENIVEEK